MADKVAPSTTHIASLSLHLWRVNGLVHSVRAGRLAVLLCSADSKLVVFECHINYRCLVDAYGSPKRRKPAPTVVL